MNPHPSFPIRSPLPVVLILGSLLLSGAADPPQLPEPERPPSSRPVVPITPEPADVAILWPETPVLADNLPEGLHAGNLLGQKVLGLNGIQLGVLRELVIRVDQGQVEYAVVGGGGFLGLGETRRLVPATALIGPVPMTNDGRPFLSLDEPAWQQAPSFEGDPLAALRDDRQREEIDGYFREVLGPDVIRARKSGADQATLPNPIPAGGRKWMLARELKDAEVRSGSAVIGEVESILVDLNHLGALVRVAPRASLVGTTKHFILRFNQLAPDPADEESLTTFLTAADFKRVLPDLTGRAGQE